MVWNQKQEGRDLETSVIVHCKETALKGIRTASPEERLGTSDEKRSVKTIKREETKTKTKPYKEKSN